MDSLWHHSIGKSQTKARGKKGSPELSYSLMVGRLRITLCLGSMRLQVTLPFPGVGHSGRVLSEAALSAGKSDQGSIQEAGEQDLL